MIVLQERLGSKVPLSSSWNIFLCYTPLTIVTVMGHLAFWRLQGGLNLFFQFRVILRAEVSILHGFYRFQSRSRGLNCLSSSWFVYAPREAFLTFLPGRKNKPKCDWQATRTTLLTLKAMYERKPCSQGNVNAINCRYLHAITIIVIKKNTFGSRNALLLRWPRNN